MNAPDELLELAQKTVSRARTAGADEAEVFIKETRRLAISAHGQLTQPTESHTIGVGVRIVHEGAIGVASSAGLHRIETVVDEALAAARDAKPAAGFRLPEPLETHRGVTPVPEAFHRPDADALQQQVHAVLEAVHDPRTDFKSVHLSVGSIRFVVANSHGLETWDQGGRQNFNVELRVGHGTKHVTAWDTRSATAPIPLNEGLMTTALDAQRRALDALQPQPLARDVHVAVLAPTAVAQLLGRLAQTLSGRMMASGASPLSDTMGKEVAAACVSIDDVPIPSEGPPRARVDHEGVPTQNLTLIENGVARGTYDDTLSGLQNGGSNGHGLRRGWSGNVSPGLLTPQMRPGNTSWSDLISEAGEAILIEEPLTGMLTASLETGQFSAVLPYAYLVRRGEIAHALPNVTVSGNVLDVAKNIEAVENRTHETPSGHYPGIRAGGLTCAT